MQKSRRHMAVYLGVFSAHNRELWNNLYGDFELLQSVITTTFQRIQRRHPLDLPTLHEDSFFNSKHIRLFEPVFYKNLFLR